VFGSGGGTVVADGLAGATPVCFCVRKRVRVRVNGNMGGLGLLSKLKRKESG